MMSNPKASPRAFFASLVAAMLLLSWMLWPSSTAPMGGEQVAHAAAQEGDRVTSPAAPMACPAAPAGLPDILEPAGEQFCVFYDDTVTSDAEAQQIADDVADYWDRYDIDYGFNAPLVTGVKLEVRILTNAGCNGVAWENYIEVWDGCLGTAEIARQTTGHEVFHRVQFSYDPDWDPNWSDQAWLYEGTARAMQDAAFAFSDTWVDANTMSFSFNREVNNYLSSTNTDLTSFARRYESALWWKFFSEQYGSTAGEPQLGVDAWRRLWEATATQNDIAAVNSALGTLGAGVNFDGAFRQFTVANYTKDLTSLPDNSYNYIDEDQAGNPMPYGPLVPASGGPISNGSPAVWNNQSVTRYGARYYSATIGADCPVISASFHRDSGSDAFYHVVTQKGTAFDQHVEGSGADWTQSFLNDGITRITAVIGGQNNSAQVDVTLSCADPVVDIRLPNDIAEAHVGPFDGPGKFLAQVLVTNGSPTGPVVGGLTNSDFKARVNGANALVVAGGFVQEQYWLVIQAPNQAGNGDYDLEILLEEPGTTNVLATDTNASSVVYDPDNTDQVLVIDRSGSMSTDDKMEAARDAANFYIDVTRNNDGLAVVPYDHNVSPAPFAMQSANLTVRNNAKTYVAGLTPGGLTSIGDGMQEAVNQLAASPTGNPRCSFVLMSDGMENAAAFWADVQAAVVGTGCPVSSIAFGPATNETLMQNIATATGGLFFYNDVFVSSLRSPSGVGLPSDTALDLANTYEYAQAGAEGRERLLAEKGEVPYFDEVENSHTVLVDETLSEMLFALDWTGPFRGMNLRLRAPDGTIYDQNNLPYTFVDYRSGHLGWRIQNPQEGEWEMLVSYLFQGPDAENAPDSPSGEGMVPYQVIASGHSNLNLNLLLPYRVGESYFTGNRLPINAFLTAREPICDGSVRAIVTSPLGTETLVPLFDDGQHDDGSACDGLYGGTYTRVNEAIEVVPTGEDTREPEPNDEGGYRVRLLASGPTFQREALGSFSVLEGDDRNNNGVPDPYEDEYGPDSADPDADVDLDGLTGLDEYMVGTSPIDSDSDGGGENDGSEVALGQDPLDPADDQIEAPEFLRVLPGDGSVRVTYDIKPEYESAILYRSTNPNGPWELRDSELPLSGVYTDTATNEQPYFYRFLARDGDNHGSAVIASEPVTPSDDPVAPHARVIVDDGAPSTADLSVTLSFEPYDEAHPEEEDSFSDITHVLLSNDPHFTGATWQPFAQDIPWTLAPTEPGEYALVYARFRDDASNESAGSSVGMIRYEPVGGTVIYLPISSRSMTPGN